MGRIDRINEQMKREISQMLLRDFQDPRLEFVSITSVNVSRDLRHAKVQFSVFGNKEQLHLAEEALNRAKGLVRKLIGQRIRMRYTPEIEFIYDESLEYSARIEETLERIKNEQFEDQEDS